MNTVRALMEALTAVARVWPLVMLRNAELNVGELQDELLSLVDSTDLPRVDRLRIKLAEAKRYYAALQSAISGSPAGADR